MRGLKLVLLALAIVVSVPLAAFAQATLAGLVRDTSGAVLPGATVEASSPVLIEKVRSSVSDGTGRYTIPDLRPGTYKVTFSLTGFKTVVRDGVELSGTAVLTVNADLAVGGVQETITVSGLTPVVDLQSTTRQAVMDQEIVTLDKPPTTGHDRHTFFPISFRFPASSSTGPALIRVAASCPIDGFDPLTGRFRCVQSREP